MTVSSYRLLHRVRHHIAFGGRAGRLGVADLEDQLFRNRLGTIAVDRLVVDASLPRRVRARSSGGTAGP